MDSAKLPDELTPINLRAYFSNAFHTCGCHDVEAMIDEIRALLGWCAQSFDDGRASFETLFPDREGVFYLLMGVLEGLDLSEHGTSSRCAWLTEYGDRLLRALTEHDSHTIADAEGDAYDRLYYGQP